MANESIQLMDCCFFAFYNIPLIWSTVFIGLSPICNKIKEGLIRRTPREWMDKESIVLTLTGSKLLLEIQNKNLWET